MSCGVGLRRSSDPALLWLWCRLAAAAPIGPLAWDLPYAAGATLKRQKKKKSQLYTGMFDPLTLTEETINKGNEKNWGGSYVI